MTCPRLHSVKVVSWDGSLDRPAPRPGSFCNTMLPLVAGWRLLATFTPVPESPEVLFQGPTSWCGLGQLWLPQVEVSGCAWNGACSSRPKLPLCLGFGVVGVSVAFPLL